MKTRGERREKTYKKWISRLKSVFNSGYRTGVMKIKTSDWKYNEAKTFDELKEDKYGVLLKNTGTVCSNKRLGIQEEHKRNLANRTISKEDIDEANRYMDDINDAYSFEKYCAACDNLGIEQQCPFYNKATADTEWKEIGCTEFFD